MTDQELIARAIRTSLRLIKSINARPWTDGLVFKKTLLLRGIEVLERKKELTMLESSNLQRFNDKWSIEGGKRE